MNRISASDAGAQLLQLIDETEGDHLPVTITGERHDAVLISASDWAAMQETLHLLSVPGVGESIREGLATPLDECFPAETSAFSDLSATPELTAEANSVLEPGESLSDFAEQSLRALINRRQMQREFVARGLASLEQAKRTGEYYDTDEVFQEIDDMITEAEAKAPK